MWLFFVSQSLLLQTVVFVCWCQRVCLVKLLDIDWSLSISFSAGWVFGLLEWLWCLCLHYELMISLASLVSITDCAINLLFVVVLLLSFIMSLAGCFWFARVVVVLDFFLWLVASRLMLGWFVCCWGSPIRVAFGFSLLDSCLLFIPAVLKWLLVYCDYSLVCDWRPCYLGVSPPLHVPLLLGVQVVAFVSLLFYYIAGVTWFDGLLCWVVVVGWLVSVLPCMIFYLGGLLLRGL